MWKVVLTGQQGPQAVSPSRLISEVKLYLYFSSHIIFHKHVQARVNIPALSARTIQRDIASGLFSIKAGIQVSGQLCALKLNSLINSGSSTR